MKKLIWLLIILFIVIAFCSCTSSGKLSDAKFPFALYFEGYIANKYPLPIDPTTGAKIMGTYYLQSHFTPVPGTILNAGTYIPPKYESYKEYEKRKNKEFWANILSMLPNLLWVIIPFAIVILILISRKDEEITLPDEFNQNY